MLRSWSSTGMKCLADWQGEEGDFSPILPPEELEAMYARILAKASTCTAGKSQLG